MRRYSPRAALLWAVAVVVAVATAISVAGTLASLHRRERALGREAAVLVAAHDLVRGAVVRASDITVRRWRGRPPEPAALGAPEDAVGRVVDVTLLRGSVVTRRHLTASRRDGRDGTVPRDRRAMRLVTEGGVHPSPGDAVDVLATFDPTIVGPDAEPTLVVARAVPVVSVDDGRGAPAARSGGGLRADTVGVTLLVDTADAPKLAFAAAAGTVDLAVVPPEDSGP